MSKEDAKVGQILHVALMVKDMDVAKENLAKLGWGPFDAEVDPPDPSTPDIDLAWLNGKKTHMFTELGRVTKCKNFGLELELIQPGESGPYREWYDAHGAGLYHIMVLPDENTTYDELVEKCVEMSGGKPLHIDGCWEMPEPPDLKWAYVDLTEELGMVLEIGANAKNAND